jgi:hypothetical protein
MATYLHNQFSRRISKINIAGDILVGWLASKAAQVGAANS